MICQIKNFFCPLGILWYKFLSYIEVLHVLSELSKLLELSELIELPEVFSSMKKCLFCGALRPGDTLIKLLKLRFVLSSESSITSHPAFPDGLHVLSESSELSQLSELIELPEVFSSMEKALLHQALRPGDLLLELRFVSRSSETSGTSGTSQSSISFRPAFPDVVSAPGKLGNQVTGLSGNIQDQEHTRCPGACGAPTDL